MDRQTNRSHGTPHLPHSPGLKYNSAPTVWLCRNLLPFITVTRLSDVFSAVSPREDSLRASDGRGNALKVSTCDRSHRRGNESVHVKSLRRSDSKREKLLGISRRVLRVMFPILDA